MANAASSAPHSRETAAAGVAGRFGIVLPAVDEAAITTRDDFLLELGQTLGGQAAVRPVESIDAALPHLSSTRRAQVLVIGLRATSPGCVPPPMPPPCRAPHAVLLVFSEAAAEAQVGSALKGSKVFAVLPLPVDARRCRKGGIRARSLTRSSARTAHRPTRAPGCG